MNHLVINECIFILHLRLLNIKLGNGIFAKSFASLILKLVKFQMSFYKASIQEIMIYVSVFFAAAFFALNLALARSAFYQ